MTVGFGDLYPQGEMEYILSSMVFIFIGLVLTTLAVDVMGSACIERIHSLGHGLDAMALLRALKGPIKKYVRLQSNSFAPSFSYNSFVFSFISCVSDHTSASLDRSRTPPNRCGLLSCPRTRLRFRTLTMRMRRVLLLLVKPSPLRAQLRATVDDSDSAEQSAALFDGVLEPSCTALLNAVAELDPKIDRIICNGPEPIRQHLIPQIVREELDIPQILLNYYDLSKINDFESTSGEFDLDARQMSLRLGTLTEGQFSSKIFYLILSTESYILHSFFCSMRHTFSGLS
ncbi:hypothetical protein DICVIV_07262 [Dictyocaulus viviparus]|uniref:Potassium channel domain-containing protein n=1 Tax=Dictyocaulus viviparus TaxID=29172 RepID=A0A0D8XSB1_DICVI|nr:hypothetical protein DICVIV_07262 [Dictyocaulus viviparus]